MGWVRWRNFNQETNNSGWFAGNNYEICFKYLEIRLYGYFQLYLQNDEVFLEPFRHANHDGSSSWNAENTGNLYRMQHARLVESTTVRQNNNGVTSNIPIAFLWLMNFLKENLWILKLFTISNAVIFYRNFLQSFVSFHKKPVQYSFPYCQRAQRPIKFKGAPEGLLAFMPLTDVAGMWTFSGLFAGLSYTHHISLS